MLKLILPLSTLLLLSFVLPRKLLWLRSIYSIFLSFLFLITSRPLIFTKISDLTFMCDPISHALMLITLWVSTLIISCRQTILTANKNPRKFLFIVISLTLILLTAFSSRSLIVFYIFFEASLIPTLLLVLGWGYQPERLQASIYLIIYTVTASLPLLLSLTKLIKVGGSLCFLPFFLFSSPLFSITAIWWVISIAAFLVKTPLYLTHLWLPKAHVEAPVAGSMILAGVLLKLGSYGLIRLAFCFAWFRKWSRSLIISVSLVGGALARLICIRQTDVKALIAYSSVGHIGLATGGIITNTIWGWQGALLILIAHGLCSSCLFALANISYETTSSRGVYLTKGLITLFPSITFWWFCLSRCNIAAPPSINLAAEILLISGSLSYSLFSAVPLAIMAFLAAAYSLLLYTRTQHGPTPSFQNPLSLFTQRNYSSVALHFIPLILFIFKLDVVLFPF